MVGTVAGGLLGAVVAAALRKYVGMVAFRKANRRFNVVLGLLSCVLFAAGLSLFLVGLNLGGEKYPWTSVRVLGTLVTGLVVLMVLGVYEWKGTSTGFLHHDLFRGPNGMGRTFAISVWLIFAEGILLFSYVVFYLIL